VIGEPLAAGAIHDTIIFPAEIAVLGFATLLGTVATKITSTFE
jgi:hypothetical protein